MQFAALAKEGRPVEVTLSAATERGRTSTSMRTLFMGSFEMKMFSSMIVRNPDGLVMMLEALFLMASLGPLYDLPVCVCVWCGINGRLSPTQELTVDFPSI